MIICKSPAEIEKLRRSGQVVRQILLETKDQVRPGNTTMELEKFVEKRIRELSALPASKGYRGYPWCLCTSVNDQIVHGMPSQRRLREGDIIGLDLGVIVEGYYGDSALTVPVGKISPEAQKLIRVTEESLELGIQQARLGNRLGDVAFAVQQHVERNGFSVVREMVGHGIGREYHEEPQVPNFGSPGHGLPLKEGMVFTIEPMVNSGGYAMRTLDDNWTTVTVDGTNSAHFEHMVAVTRNGPDVLTRLPVASGVAKSA
jgi:methionyl aminopeptidase